MSTKGQDGKNKLSVTKINFKTNFNWSIYLWPDIWCNITMRGVLFQFPGITLCFSRGYSSLDKTSNFKDETLMKWVFFRKGWLLRVKAPWLKLTFHVEYLEKYCHGRELYSETLFIWMVFLSKLKYSWIICCKVWLSKYIRLWNTSGTRNKR